MKQKNIKKKRLVQTYRLGLRPSIRIKTLLEIALAAFGYPPISSHMRSIPIPFIPTTYPNSECRILIGFAKQGAVRLLWRITLKKRTNLLNIVLFLYGSKPIGWKDTTFIFIRRFLSHEILNFLQLKINTLFCLFAFGKAFRINEFNGIWLSHYINRLNK